ncbi:hypothetical protein A2X44_01430 [candidate division CPR3 bacterium GWF2_35_18]|uniref:UAA transporter family n=1 Tax=candidate division CPR3 bacterium GW2011_GWF2_35_18 TaxID=1618350 RepID=A0A0G0C2M7_UNCC3|nr:MAG: UAA transporter family [candidate division CPR3 bacterium GW2011_GWF2_35_18]OGB63564.1 MAG: hypothetical protein A2X44_01430 [candidate division CPR3 bacterium GWF2_35_18]OGB64673.1 MAG: hypothetical protein A2250_03980 [candidate division CPR3 bacterium RIFOXYA2_FULL_35_13]OGB76705.1 MAG: hypothetical protein A2476_03030 [candidate division CPR3 bacterium RIFOXYC2_FULL_35_7]
MQSKRKQQSLGVTAILISTIFYGLMGVYSKIIGVNFGIFTQSYIRNLIVFLIIFVLCLVLRKKWVKIQKQDIPWIILWSISGTIASVCFFVAVNYLSIGTTVIIFFAGSNISGYLAGKVLYQEQLTKSKIIASILSILGVLLVYYSTIGLDNLVFSIMALFSGLGTGLWNTVSKKFSHHYSGLQITGMDAFASFLMTLFASMIVFEPLPTISFTIPMLFVFIYSITQTITVFFTVYGFKRLEAQIGTLVMPMEVFFAALFGFIFYRETLTILTILGGLLIISGIVIPNLRFAKKISIVNQVKN